ncbi:hypothetical protein FOIG 00543, putative [Babesia ovata]|uniref:Uncharacterized protein n=1 Tax=Babesia ovata TaxID=189622 RepID=A0A2H6KCM3_9APIC|nr:hypothetical protein FOIG 00543, putative [Babesia ovata]GBE60709.1 hypothetical protein FOIG 00543, putative [Babesia ovata]
MELYLLWRWVFNTQGVPSSHSSEGSRQTGHDPGRATEHCCAYTYNPRAMQRDMRRYPGDEAETNDFWKHGHAAQQPVDDFSEVVPKVFPRFGGESPPTGDTGRAFHQAS